MHIQIGSNFSESKGECNKLEKVVIYRFLLSHQPCPCKKICKWSYKFALFRICIMSWKKIYLWWISCPTKFSVALSLSRALPASTNYLWHSSPFCPLHMKTIGFREAHFPNKGAWIWLASLSLSIGYMNSINIIYKTVSQ